MKPLRPLLFLALLALLPTATPAGADRAGWNEPPRAPGYDRGGLLHINADYFALAAATGGDFYFWTPGEFAASAGALTVPIASEPIALAYGSGRSEFVQTLEVPIDASITRLSLFCGAQRLEAVELRRPDGRAIDANPAGVGVQHFEHMRIVTVSDPEPGPWQVTVRGSGCYSFAARYLAERKILEARQLQAVDLIDFTFVEQRGRPGHEGLFEVKQPPRVGETRLCRTVLSGGVSQPVIDLVSATGEVLGQVRLEESTDADELIGSCLIPKQPFRVRVRGLDRQGHLLQRLTAALFTPSQ